MATTLVIKVDDNSGGQIVIGVPVPVGTGEANTLADAGANAHESLVASPAKVGTILQNKGIRAGAGITLTDVPADNVVEISETDSGDEVHGPASATDNAPAIFDGTTGKLIKEPNASVDFLVQNITNVGTVDGRDVSADGAVLDAHVADLANPHATDVGNLGAGTLAELNTAITDATLDDSSDSRTPSGAAGGDLSGTYPNPSVVQGNISHTTIADIGTNTHPQIDVHIADLANPHATDIENLGPGTLAELNAAVTDATLDGSGDSRTPDGAASGDLSGTYPSPEVAALTSGLTQLTIGAIADGTVLTRSGTTIVGASTGGGDVVGPASSTDNAVAVFDGVTGKVIKGPNAAIDLLAQNITNVGTVDGRDVSTDGSALDTHIANLANPHVTDVGNLGSGTLAELNTAITDATLDDSGASRPPSGAAGGDLGGTYPNPTITQGNISHLNISDIGTNTHPQIDTHIADIANPHATDVGNLGSGTLAELNTTITDATLDDSGDSRTPSGAASGDLSGTYPSPAVAALTTTTGPTQLTIGAIADGETLVRSGTEIISSAAQSHDFLEFQDGSTQAHAATPDGLGWHVSTAAPSQSFSAEPQESSPRDIYFRSDGLKMYIVGSSVTASVYEYDLVAPWDIKSASFVQSFAIAAQDTNAFGLYFRADGFKMYTTGSDNDSVYEYDLSTAWDISTASFLQSFSVTTEDINPRALRFKPDGLKMYVMGRRDNHVLEYDLSTAWDISTSVFLQDFSVLVFHEGLDFKSDGLIMYTASATTGDISEYNLATPWDISTAQLDQVLTSDPPNPHALVLKTDGSKMYTTFDPSSSGISEFDLGVETGGVVNINGTTLTAPLQSTWDMVKTIFSGESLVLTGITALQAIEFNPGGTKMFIGDSTVQDVSEYALSTPWDLNRATFLQSFAAAITIEGISFKDDGTKMYLLNSTATAFVREYDLSTQYDVSTAVFLQDFSVNTESPVSKSLAFKDDGTSFYVLGTTNAVHQYDMPTPWDISTASFNQSYDYSNEGSDAQGLEFRGDGLKMYVQDNTLSTVFEYDLATAWDLSTVTYTGKLLALGDEDTDVRDISISPDGLRLYSIGSAAADTVYRYDIETESTLEIDKSISVSDDVTLGGNLDVTGRVLSGASFVRTFEVDNEELSPNDVFFRPDGLRMYILGTGSDNVNAYVLSTAWDISTASFLNLFSVAAQDSIPIGLFIRDDGLKMYITGDAGNDVNEYDLATAWDVSTSSFLQSFDMSTRTTSPTGVHFKPDGSRMYISDSDTDLIDEYLLVTPWDISTAYFYDSLDVSTETSVAEDVFFSRDGLRMFVTGPAAVFEYELASAWSVSTASVVGSLDVSAQDLSTTGACFSTDMSRMYTVGGFSIGAVYEYDLDGNIDVANGLSVGATLDVGSKLTALDFEVGSSSEAWDISTAAFVQLFNTTAQDTNPQGVFFRADGLKMYINGSTADAVYEYDLTMGWDVSTASFLQSFSISSTAPDPRDIFFREDGLRMYVVGNTNTVVAEYALTTAWDLSTASGTQGFDVSSQDAQPVGIWMDATGRRMYVSGNINNAVFEYYLTTPWDVSTAVYSGNSFSVAAQEINQRSIIFESDGSRFYIGGRDSDIVAQYSLSVPWDISSASFVQSVGIGSQTSNPGGIFINPIGNKMFVVAQDNDNVFEYNIDAADITDGGTIHGNLDVIAGEIRQNGILVNGNAVVYINSVDDLPDAVGGVIPLLANTTYIGDKWATTLSLTDTLSFRFNTRLLDVKLTTDSGITVEPGGSFDIRNCDITYTGSGTLLSGTDIVSVNNIFGSDMTLGPTSTMFDLTTVNDPLTFFAMRECGVFGGALGTIDGMGVILNTVRFVLFSTGLTLNNLSAIAINAVQMLGTNTATTFLDFNGTSQEAIHIVAYSPTIQSNEFALNFDATTSFNSPVTVIGCVITGTTANAFEAGSFDQTTPGFKFVGNTNIPDSKALGFGEMNANATATAITAPDTYQAIDVSTVTDNVVSERFTLTDAAAGIYTYTGITDFTGTVSAKPSAFKSGSTADYRFAVSVNGAIPVFASTFYAPLEVKTTKVSVVVDKAVSLVTGNTVQIMVAGEGTTDSITISDFVINISG